jgi:HicB family
MADKTADAIKLNLRLPKPLHRRLKQQARHNSVSLNTEIINQLEGSEAATAKRMAEIMKPLVADAISEWTVTVQLPSHDEIGANLESGKFYVRHASVEIEGLRAAVLDLILRDMPAPHTEPALEEELRRKGYPSERAAGLLQLFRERQAGTRLSAREKM